MSKARKLVRSPGRFFADALLKRLQPIHNSDALMGRKEIAEIELNAKSTSSSSKSAEKKPKVIVAAASRTTSSKTLANSAEPSTATKVMAKKPASKPVVSTETDVIPAWYRGRPDRDLREALASDKPIFLYIPWIAEHGDSLLERIKSPDDYKLAPLDFVRDLDFPDRRRGVLRFARENPDVYRRMIVRRLVPIRNRIAGVIFTFDWAPVMRIISTACEELEIPRILVPHESVFVDRNKYYWDPKSSASVPTADVILGWGELQKSIYCERGYPEDRFISVGAPKFDAYADYQAKTTRSQYAALFGLDPVKKIALFATQPLDSQLNMRIAREAQRSAIKDLLDASVKFDFQIIVRLPPSKDDIIGSNLSNDILSSGRGAIDDANCYLVPAEEAIHHCDLVCSINSTMLFEGVLAGRPALSMKYTEFEQIWDQAGIPSVSTSHELNSALPSLLSGEWVGHEEGLKWASRQFSSGTFDGRSADRIRDYLRRVSNDPTILSRRDPVLQRIMSAQSVDTIGVPSSDGILAGPQRHIADLLRARTVIQTKGAEKKVEAVASVDVFIQWGITPKPHKVEQANLAKRLCRPTVIVEDGFLRSLRIGLSGDPALSILVDDRTAYYDATKQSRLAINLESERELSRAEWDRAHRAIQSIQSCRLSKYNHAPDLKLSIGSKKQKLLLVDQRFGDESVRSGLADEASFDRMIHDVMRTRRDWDIIIKQHPDALKGGKQSYLTKDRFPFRGYAGNLHFIDFDVNPHSLFDIVDEVYVVSSGVGMEALMAGKTVYCYGMPFYAGWGATIDEINVAWRTRKRSVAEIFHFSYVEASRYYSPDLGRACEIEEIIEYLARSTRFASPEALPAKLAKLA